MALPPDDLGRTPMHGAYPADIDTDWIDVYGFAVPLVVTDPEEEYAAFREAVGVLEYSMLYKWELTGPGAKGVANSVHSRNVAGVGPGCFVYGAVADADGLMVDDATVAVYGDDRVVLMGGTTELGGLLAEALVPGVELRERREDFVVAAVQGPRSRELLQRLTTTDLSNEAFPYYTFRDDVVLAGIPVQINRIGFTAELGYEVMGPAERALELHEALFSHGEDLGIRMCGAAALMMCRIEAGMVMGEVEYDRTVSPFECRLGWAVDFDKGPFLAREALLAAKDTAVGRVVTIRVEGEADGLDGGPVSCDGEVVGAMTMVVPSPYLGGASLGMARVHKDAARPGTSVVVTGLDGERAGEVVATPVYDPQRIRVRS